MEHTFDLTCDVAVIGAGTAGLTAARKALDQGARIVLIDDKFAGTVCANVGCMPSKLIIAASKAAHGAQTADIFGIDCQGVTIDGPAVMGRLRAERDKFVASTKKSLDDFPAGSLIKARARFAGPTSLVLDDGRTIGAKSIVIAVGGAPIVPDAFSGLGALCLTHETIFEIEDLPRSIAVIGAGPIGLELAQALARLGVETTLFDQAQTIAKVADDDVQSCIQKALRDDLTLHLGVTTSARREGDRALIQWSGASNGQAQFDRVLIATGRPPQLDALDLEKSGIARTDKGAPLYNRETMQCGDAPIFIAGDASADAPILHEAAAEGRIAGRNAATFPSVTRTPRMTKFSLIFSQPALAMVGTEPDEETIVGRASYDDQGRAKVEAQALGRVLVYAEPTRGRITGAMLFCPGAEHMAHLFALAISRGVTATEMLAQPFYHPTLEEGLKAALREICRAVPASGDFDRTDPPGA